MTPKPPRAWVWAFALALAVTWPFLRAPSARFGDDDLEYAIPFSRFVLGELAHGRVPLWNPATDGGMPLLAQQPWMGPLYPGLALFAVLPDGCALSAGYALHALIYAGGIAVLLRTLGASAPSAWLVAAVLGLSSDVAVTWNRGYLHHLVALSWVAWPIAALERARRGASAARSAALGALALGLSFLGGHPVSALQGALAFAIWSGAAVAVDLVTGGRDERSGSRARAGIRSAAVAGAIALGALGVAAAQLVPLRAVASDGTLATQREWKPWDREMASPWRKVGYLLPAWEAGHKGRDFVGVTTILLAAAGLAAVASRRTREVSGASSVAPTIADAVPGVALATAFGLLSFGPHAPFFGWAVALAPPLGMISYSYFFAPGIHVGLACLAAAGLDASLDRRAARRTLAALAVAALLAVGAVFGVRAELAADPLDHGGIARSAAPAALAASALFAVTALHALGRVERSRWLGLVSLVVIAELVGYRVSARADKPRYDTAAYFHADDPLVRELVAPGTKGRIWHVERTRPVGEWLLRRNGGLVLGYDEIARSSRVGVRTYRDFVAPLGADVEWETALAASDRGDRPGGAALEIDDARLAVLDGLGVDRIVTDLPLAGPGASAFEVDATDASGRVHLHSRVGPAPVALDAAGGDPSGAVATSSPIGAGRVSFEVQASHATRVLVRQNPLDGWRATLDPGSAGARELDVVPDAGGRPAFTVDVPAGRHRVDVWYRPPRWPFALSAVTALLAIAAAAWPRSRRAW